MKDSENIIVTSISKFAIVRAIATLLKLGDEGKVESFLTKVIKRLKKEIVVYKKSLENAKFNYDQEVDELEEKLEDAAAAYDASLLEIDPTKVDSNEKQAYFIDIYLDNIDSKLLAVQRIEKNMENAKETYNKKVEEFNAQIASLTKRLTAIEQA